MNWRAPRLCDLASDWLAARYPDALIVRELSVGKWGSAMLDIAAITADHIYGVEIKGDGDSHARLDRQGWIYSRVASRMFLLSAPSLDAAATKHLPSGWWHLRAGESGVQAGHLDRNLWGHIGGPDQLPNAPAQLLECLITRELKRVGKVLTPAVDIGKTVPTMIAAISENAPLKAVRAAVCDQLRARDWLAYDRSINKSREGRYRWADGRPMGLAA